MVDLKKILAPGRRRKKPRADAPRTIVPPADRFDAAKARLREQIPPKNDD